MEPEHERKRWRVEVEFKTRRRDVKRAVTYIVTAPTEADASNEVCWLHYTDPDRPERYTVAAVLATGGDPPTPCDWTPRESGK